MNTENSQKFLHCSHSFSKNFTRNTKDNSTKFKDVTVDFKIFEEECKTFIKSAKLYKFLLSLNVLTQLKEYQIYSKPIMKNKCRTQLSLLSFKLV